MTPTGRFFTGSTRRTASTTSAIAAGSGITPVLSIVASTLAAEPRRRR